MFDEVSMTEYTNWIYFHTSIHTYASYACSSKEENDVPRGLDMTFCNFAEYATSPWPTSVVSIGIANPAPSLERGVIRHDGVCR
jgi:hypothetical protein